MHYVMTDIHGDYQHFVEMLEQVGFGERDVLYILGDVIDRGDQNLEMLEFCMQRENVVLIRGNHEFFMQLVLEGRLRETDWIRFGGRRTLLQLEEISREREEALYYFLRGLPWYVVLTQEEVPGLDRPYLLTHTGFLRPDPAMDLPDFCYPDLSGREAFDVEQALSCWIQEFPWEYMVSSDLYELPETVRFDKRLLVGHVPTISGYAFEPVPYILERREYLDLDCGGFMRREGGRLACLRLEDMRVWYI